MRLILLYNWAPFFFSLKIFLTITHNFLYNHFSLKAVLSRDITFCFSLQNHYIFKINKKMQKKKPQTLPLLSKHAFFSNTFPPISHSTSYMAPVLQVGQINPAVSINMLSHWNAHVCCRLQETNWGSKGMRIQNPQPNRYVIGITWSTQNKSHC